MMHKKLFMAVILQILWAIGCVFWNAYGLWLISQSQAPIGPTASITGVIVCMLFLICFVLFRKNKWIWPYIVVSLIAGLMAAATIYGGFTKDHSLWPSEFWRFAGIFLNGIGVIAAILAIKESLGKTSYSTDFKK